MIAGLPRGATRRLYTAPHSLLDTFPAQLPRQLLSSTADDSLPAPSAGISYQQLQAGVSSQRGFADRNVLLERARVSPVSSAASSQSTGSVNSADNERIAAPAQQFVAKTPSMDTAAAAAAAAPNWRPAITCPAMDHAYSYGTVSGQVASPNQFPAFAVPSVPASDSDRPPASESQSPLPPLQSGMTRVPFPAESGSQRSSAVTGYNHQVQPQRQPMNQPQQSGALQDANHETHPHHTAQFTQDYTTSAAGEHSLSAYPSYTQDQLLDDPQPQLHNQYVGDGAVLPPDHPASQLSTVPILAPKPGLPLPQDQLQSGASAQANPDLIQSSSSQRAAPVLFNTPMLSVNQSHCLPTSSTEAAKLCPELGSGKRPSWATAGQQHSFSVVPVNYADEVAEADLSQRQRALRSLSSKGIETSPTASGKGCGGVHTLRGGGLVSPGKLSPGPRQGQLQGGSSNEAEGVGSGQPQRWGVEGVQEPLSRRAGAVRALASQLNLGK